MGKLDTAKSAAAANINAWSREMDGAGLDAIIINTSGCGTTVKDYAHMFRTDDALRDKAAKVASIAMDITEFLARHGYEPTREAPGRTVAYHAACSLQHGQKITDAPKLLLRKAGFTVKEPTESHICCGSAGTYNMLQPEISARLKARKLANLNATKADVIAAGNIGCLTQLGGDTMPTVHTVQLLDWMAGGPKPAALGA
jgi:glycolate oxidase iron-sulfur subunit